MFRYSTVAGDAGWVGANYDGSTQSVTAKIADIAASTVYLLTIAVSGNGALVTYTIDANPPVTLSTNIATGNAMRILAGIIPQVSSTRNLDIRSEYLEVPVP